MDDHTSGARLLDRTGLTESQLSTLSATFANDRAVITPPLSVSSASFDQLRTFTSTVVDPLKSAIIDDVAEPLLELLRALRPNRTFGEPEHTLVVPRPGGDPASSSGQGNFDTHNDLAFLDKRSRMLFALFCLHPARSGGENGWVPARHLHTVLSADSRRALESLKVRFHPPPYATQAAYSYVDESSDDGHILSYDTDGEPILRWNPHCVDGDVLAHPAVAELRQHIERFRAHASGTGLATGMMLIGDNRYGLHWREPFEGDRLLLRIYYPYE